MKEKMKKNLIQNLRSCNLCMLVWRILLVYIVLWLCRAVFWIYNADLIGTTTSEELGQLIYGSWRFDTVSMLYVNIFFIVLSLIPLRLREKEWWQKIMFWYYIAVNTLTVVVLNVADIIYFNYTQKRFTSDELFFADNDNSLKLIMKFAAENWYLILFGMALIALLWYGYGRKARPTHRIGNKWAFFGVNMFTLACAIGLSIGGIRGGFSHSTRPITLSNATDHTKSVSKAYLILSNPFCTIRTMGNEGISYKKYYEQEQLDSLYTPYHYPDTTAMAAPLKNKNIIIFILESFSAEHSAFLNPELYAGKSGYTPFLDSLMKEGLTFWSCYSNGHKSIEAMPSILGSIPSFKTPFVLMPQSLGESRQLPKILAEQGYTTSFFLGSPRSSMGFGAYANNAGIDNIYAMEDYEKIHGNGDFDGWWGIWDEPMIQYTGSVLNTTQQPFMATLYTITSHHPFVYPEEYEGRFDRGQTKLHYPVQYTDHALRQFFATYGNEEWFRNSAFVFVADHVSSETFTPEANTLMGGNRIISFIYTPDGSVKGIHNGITQQIDIMPTLLGLMGYNEPYFGFGNDIFAPSDQQPTTIGFSSKAMQFYIADAEYVVLFDENSVTKVFRTDDPTETPIAEPWPDRIHELETQLKATIQQYYHHLESQIFKPLGV